jgi:hypothetical protein
MRANIRKSLWWGMPEGGGLSPGVPGPQAFVDIRLIGSRETRCFRRRFNIVSHVAEGLMRSPSFAVLLAVSVALAACGSSPGTRAVTGGLMGAGAGAGVSALTGGRPATGALIGGGIGAVGGAVTR